MSAACEPPRVYAIVPAAGRSRRMGHPKQLLDVDGRPMLLATLAPLAAAGVAGIALVTHRAIAQRVDFSGMSNVFLAHNEDERSAMIDSVRIGLRAWLARACIGDQDGFLVCPADHPDISTADFSGCITAFCAAPDRIVIACRAGERGHPIIFPAALASFVQSPACDPGLNTLPRTFPDRVRLVECQSPGVTHDVDTPDDHARWP